MKFKLMLAGLILPVGILSFSNQNDNRIASISSAPKPYIVEVITSSGSIETSKTGTSGAGSAFAVAREIGVIPNFEDKFTSFPDIKMGMGGKITIYRAPLYTVIDGKKKQERRSWKDTVGDLILEARIPEVGDDDKINFSLGSKLELGMEIKIIRVALTNVKKTEQIDFKVIKKDDSTLDKGKTRVEKAGVKGEKILTYLVRREDGVEVSRKLTNTEITKEPVNQILIIGTKPVITVWCKYNDWVLDASIKNGIDPDRICNLMKKESWGHPDSVGQNGAYVGLFQYDPGFWSSVSAKAGYPGADIYDAKAQIYVTAWAFAHGYAGRW